MTSTLLLPPGTPPPSSTATTRNALPTCKSTTTGEEVHEDQDTEHHGRRIWAPCSARSTYSTRRHSTSCRHHGLSCSRRPSLRRGRSCSRPPRHPLSPHATSVAPPRPWAAPPRAFSLLTRRAAAPSALHRAPMPTICHLVAGTCSVQLEVAVGNGAPIETPFILLNPHFTVHNP
jgi:hypothetical protein